MLLLYTFGNGFLIRTCFWACVCVRFYPHRSGVKNVSEIALVRIYLGQTDTWLYKQTVSTKWFEIISNVGGLCGLVSGFSLISLAELLYFVVRIVLAKCHPFFRISTVKTTKTEQPRKAEAMDNNDPAMVLYILP